MSRRRIYTWIYIYNGYIVSFFVCDEKRFISFDDVMGHFVECRLLKNSQTADLMSDRYIHIFANYHCPGVLSKVLSLICFCFQLKNMCKIFTMMCFFIIRQKFQLVQHIYVKVQKSKTLLISMQFKKSNDKYIVQGLLIFLKLYVHNLLFVIKYIILTTMIFLHKKILSLTLCV